MLQNWGWKTFAHPGECLKMFAHKVNNISSSFPLFTAAGDVSTEKPNRTILQLWTKLNQTTLSYFCSTSESCCTYILYNNPNVSGGLLQHCFALEDIFIQRAVLHCSISPKPPQKQCLAQICFAVFCIRRSLLAIHTQPSANNAGHYLQILPHYFQQHNGLWRQCFKKLAQSFYHLSVF